MTTLGKFEEIDAWKYSRKLTKLIYKYSAGPEFRKDYCLCDQIRRSAISVMSNIAEGFDREGNKEFVQFLSIAKGSAAELQAQLYIALDNNYITQKQFNEIYEVTVTVKSLLSGFMRYLKSSDIKGYKYKHDS